MEDKVTAQQWSALVEWCAWLTVWSGHATLDILAHKSVTPDDPDYTDCPGEFIHRIPALREAVAAAVAGITGTPSPSPSPSPLVFATPGAVPAPVPLAYHPPAYAADRLAEAPWSNAQPLPAMNGYGGLVKGSFHRFTGIAGLPGGAVLYESKFAIDADGDAPPVPGDTFLPDTSLHRASGSPLNTTTYPFAVIPLVKPGNQTLPKFASLGIRLGDLGMALWKDNIGRLTYAAFIFGDEGPKWNRVGEGSRYLARQLGINDDPNVGGIDASEIPPGIIHIVFPGTSDVQDFHSPRTSRSREDIATLVNTLSSRFFGQA